MKLMVKNVRKEKLDRIKADIVCWRIEHFLFFNITKRVFYSAQEHIVMLNAISCAMHSLRTLKYLK